MARVRPRKLIPGIPVTSEDLRDYHRAIEELQEAPERRYIEADTPTGRKEDVVLVNGQVNKLKHRLGRRLKGWVVKDLRGATATGRIVRVLSAGNASANDDTDLWLDVVGWGNNITVRIEVE